MINEKKKSGKKDACYHKVKSRYSVWPSAYASGALVKCRKKGAKNWGNSRKDEALHAAYFNFAASLVNEDAIERAAMKAKEAEEEKRKAAEAAAANDEETPAPEKPKKRRPGEVDPSVDAVGSPEEIEKIRRRSEREERTARAAARGTTRPKIRYRTVKNPDGTSSLQAIRQGLFKFEPEQFGKSGFLKSGAGINYASFSRTGDEKSRYRAILRGIAGTQPLRTARARLERLADRGLVRSGARIRQGFSSFQKGRASQRRNGGNMDFSHTEYQRIGAILAEAKGVMPKKFSVKSGDKSAAGGLTAKGVKRYRAANPGSKLKTAVTTKPSKLKKGSKSAKRRKSFCARMGGMKKRLTSSKTANDPNSRINKALRKWNC